MDQAAWIGNAIIQMSALVLLLGAPLLSGDIALLINRASGLNLQIDHELPAEKIRKNATRKGYKAPTQATSNPKKRSDMLGRSKTYWINQFGGVTLNDIFSVHFP